MTLRRSERPRYPLHRTFVAKSIRQNAKAIAFCINNDVQSNKETDDSRLESPFVRIGCLVEFHLREDQTRVYTIRWDHSKTSREGIREINSDLISQSESRPELQLGSPMPRADDSPIEQWTESRVTVGILLHKNIGLKVAKRFDTGIFVGQVTDVYHTGDQTNEVLYHIEYEDGDSEDFDEQELREGIQLYSCFHKRKRPKVHSKATIKYGKSKKARFKDSLYPIQEKNGTSQSFSVLYDDTTPIHTLILGTHPGKTSLRNNQYFSHKSNAFWWITGDCLGFRRDRGEKQSGGLMKLCRHLRYDETYIVPYDKQVNILCQHGFALWDIIESCKRLGSLDSAISNDKPNDIQTFVEQHPTIRTIVMANGKSGLAVFTRHFSDWLESGKLVLPEQKVGKKSKATSNLEETIFVRSKNVTPISLISAPSVSPAAATLPYREKRDLWETFVFAPGLKFEQELAMAKKFKCTPTPASTPI